MYILFVALLFMFRLVFCSLFISLFNPSRSIFYDIKCTLLEAAITSTDFILEPQITDLFQYWVSLEEHFMVTELLCKQRPQNCFILNFWTSVSVFRECTVPVDCCTIKARSTLTRQFGLHKCIQTITVSITQRDKTTRYDYFCSSLFVCLLVCMFV